AFLGPLAFAFGHKAIGKTDGRAAFAFADMPAKAQGLAKGQPFLIGKAAPDHGVPQDQDIDAGIIFAARGAARDAQTGRPGGAWAHPWDHALVHFRDDAGGYFVIQGNAALAASLVIGVWAHGYPPARKNPHPSPGKRGGRRNATGRPAIEAGCTLKGPRARVTRGDGAVAKRRTGEAGCDPPGRAYKGAPPTPIFRGPAKTKSAAIGPPSRNLASGIEARRAGTGLPGPVHKSPPATAGRPIVNASGAGPLWCLILRATGVAAPPAQPPAQRQFRRP